MPGIRGPKRSSNPWKSARALLPLLGTLAFGACPAAGAAADAADFAAARAWLAGQVPRLLGDTTTPVRVLALSALVLRDTPEAPMLADIVCGRQSKAGWWAGPGTSGALADQAAALILAASHGRREATLAGLARLVEARQKPGGWSSTMGRHDHADAISTALAAQAIQRATAGFDFTAAENGRMPGLSSVRSSTLEFIRTVQDDDTGAIGYDARVNGDWGSTAAGIVALAASGYGRCLPLRRAIVALDRPDALGHFPRQPLTGAWMACALFTSLPEQTGRLLSASLGQQLAHHQQADGRWPAPRQHAADGDEFTTAVAILCGGLLDRGDPGPPLIPPPTSPAVPCPRFPGARILLSLPAEKADTLLFNPSDTGADRLLVTCDFSAVGEAFRARAFDPSGRVPRPWGEALAGLILRAKAGVVAPDTIQRFVSNELRLRPHPLLAADEIASLIDPLDAPTDKRLARALSRLDATKLFSEARELWAGNKTAGLEALLEANVPGELRPAVARLRALAAERIAGELAKGGRPLIVLEAWLALGPDGVLARLGAPPVAAEKPGSEGGRGRGDGSERAMAL